MKISRLLILLSLLSCGKEDRTDPHPKKRPIKFSKNEEKKDRFEQIFHQENFEKELDIGKVAPGDILKFEITGVKTSYHFIPTFMRKVTSHWIKDICLPLPPKKCYPVPRKGVCEMYYRYPPGEIKNKVTFSKNPLDWKLRVRIGENSYRLTRINKKSNDKIVAIFPIYEVMTTGNNNASLAIASVPKIKKTKIGFIKFGFCEGKGGKDFKVKSSRESKSVRSSSKEVYTANIFIDRK